MSLHLAGALDGAHDFTLEMAPGHEELWFALRYLPKQFTASDLARSSGAKLGFVELHLARLARHGVLAKEGVSTDNQAVYHKGALNIWPVVLDEQGRPSQAYQRRQKMWTAARQLKTFTIGKLLSLVQDHLPGVKRRDVEAFVTRLVRGTYFVLIEGPGHDGEPEYFLRPKMNTGPIAPRFCEAELLYDINRRAFYGHGLAQEVAA